MIIFFFIGLNNSYYDVSLDGHASVPLNIINRQKNKQRYWPIELPHRYKITNYTKRLGNIHKSRIHRFDNESNCQQCIDDAQMSTLDIIL